MRNTIRKIQFKLKNPKSQIDQAIFLNEEYSKIIRQLHVVAQKDNKQPIIKRLQTTQQQLFKITQNLQKQKLLYDQYQNGDLYKFKKCKEIPNIACLISSYQQKQFQIKAIELRKNQQLEGFKQKLSKNNVDKELQQIQKKLLQQKNKRVCYQNKINRIKVQLQEQAKILMKEKTNNFQQQIKLRKLQKMQCKIQDQTNS